VVKEKEKEISAKTPWLHHQGTNRDAGKTENSAFAGNSFLSKKASSREVHRDLPGGAQKGRKNTVTKHDRPSKKDMIS